MFDFSLDEAPDGATLFENADWRVCSEGLEHRSTGYFVARDEIAMRRRDGLWAWPLQIGEKSWCGPRPFREAFLAALDLFGVARDELLTRSFAAGFEGGGRAGRDGFVALGDLVRPRSAARRRPVPADIRAVPRGGAGAMAQIASGA